MFRFLTAGESHGKGLTAIIEGMVAGLPLVEADINRDLERRQRGHGRGGRMKIESDRAEITSGVRHGKTLGSPISLLIENRDWKNWQDSMSVSAVEAEQERVTRLRPGHADLAGVLKYGFDDVRNVLERSSARETAARVAVGAVARKFLGEFGVTVRSHTVAIGGKRANVSDVIDWDRVEGSPVRCADPAGEREMIVEIDKAKSAGDTLGGVFEVVATGLPVGLGSHVQWDRKLSSRICQAISSINAIKGVEIGAGFVLADIPGSRAHDLIEPRGSEKVWRRSSNRSGGIEGGMSNGEPVVVRAAMKPIATLAKPLPSVDLDTGERVDAHYERSDVCAVPAAGVVGEAMLAIVLAEATLEKFGGDSIDETLHNFKGYVHSLARRLERG
ncbi:MAG: chorismate synthase [Dehalococcoidia bacterium]|nr:chorismate synthase [Dehalococcoidia bacterium]